MLRNITSIKILTVFFFCVLVAAGNAQNLNLKVIGDSISGFNVVVYNGEKLLLNNTEEFSLNMANLDLSENVNITNWKGEKWTGNKKKIRLTRDTFIEEFDLNLSITVTYEIINEQVIRKSIDLFQSGMPALYFTIKEISKPAEAPSKYVSFEHDDFPGGFAHEMFPSIGFVTPDNHVVGFLTDAGYKNHYTRSTRRRFNGHGGGFVGMRKLPDPALVSSATLTEREKGEHYVQYTFGEMYNLDAGKELIYKVEENFKKVGDAKIETNSGVISIASKTSGRSGIEVLTPLQDQKSYTVSFLSKGNALIALKLFRIKNGKKTVELEHGIKYIDNFPVKETEWTAFKGSILVPYIQNDSVAMFLTQLGNKSKLEIKDLQIIEHEPKKEPYNKMNMGEKVTKTTYIFVEPWTNHHDFVVSSQSRLAEAKGFEGTQIEKMLYANFNMLTWITSVNDFTPLNVPNMNYAPDMYNRDSFFSITSSYNEELNLKIWDQWAKTQTSKGAIATIITPYMGTVEAKDNEATIQWLIWAMLNKRRYGVALPKEKIDKTVEYVLNEFDKDKDGLCKSHFTLNQIDIIEYTPKTDRLAVNQGMFAIALRTIKELGYDISEEYIKKAEEGYRDFYDAKKKHILFDRKYPDIISLTDLEPEFFSLWLFERNLLTDNMVVNHLEQIPVLNKVSNSPYPEFGTTAPILVRLTKDEKGYAYLNEKYQPFAEFGESNYKDGSRDGFYYNGGSWMRAEYMAYVVGLKHGWQKARKLMENRAWAEINLNSKWPYSKEFIPTKWESTDSWWHSTRGLCWNVFILMADEVAGIRTKEMDPDYKNK
ncbi:hypothetical protein L1I30_06930 [Gillisia sp. M10.2A]|uniref:Glycosyl hydrolase family 63 C-terminal domain-containing protein n=1 Tax=Gillisia lutea TaxID=2909668 RepID=A0ABS9EEU7_9FLAO|nr:hypothetical protein [Gillisia lutea]MCF4101393.1 hypothetical protein [Gillisia lutea]